MSQFKDSILRTGKDRFAPQHTIYLSANDKLALISKLTISVKTDLANKIFIKKHNGGLGVAPACR